ncbi:hypothetical protein T440DRAFT_536467, partial [Plenodomus tracheiphilus IPT5]
VSLISAAPVRHLLERLTSQRRLRDSRHVFRLPPTYMDVDLSPRPNALASIAASKGVCGMQVLLREAMRSRLRFCARFHELFPRELRDKVYWELSRDHDHHNIIRKYPSKWKRGFVHELLQTFYANYTLDMEPLGSSAAEIEVSLAEEVPGVSLHVGGLIHNVDVHVKSSTPGSHLASTFLVKAGQNLFAASPAKSERSRTRADGPTLSRSLRLVLSLTQEAACIRIITHDSCSPYWPSMVLGAVTPIVLDGRKRGRRSLGVVQQAAASYPSMPRQYFHRQWIKIEKQISDLRIGIGGNNRSLLRGGKTEPYTPGIGVRSGINTGYSSSIVRTEMREGGDAS